MSKIVFLLEGMAEKKMLESFLPRFLPEIYPSVQWQLIRFNGKQDLEKNLCSKLRGWRTPNTFFIVLRDQDQENCHQLKKRLCAICNESGQKNWIVRIACHELENWYLGDMEAVEKALGVKGLAKHQNKSKYRSPDSLSNAADELTKLTDGFYTKVLGSESIGLHLSINGNTSSSFNVFLAGIRRALRLSEKVEAES